MIEGDQIKNLSDKESDEEEKEGEALKELSLLFNESTFICPTKNSQK